jgi:CheY-like chemotaxis protein
MGESIQVLLIEDNIFVRDTIKDCTAGMKCSFEEAEDEKEALELISDHDFDVIFLDVGLPGEDGFEILKKAKQLKPDLAPVIVLTGYMQQAHKMRAEALGAFAFLTKAQLSTKEITIAITMAIKSRVKSHGEEN